MDDVPKWLDARELAARLGITVRTLRSWVKAGALPDPGPAATDRFSRDAIIGAQALAALRHEGVPLMQAAQFVWKCGPAELRTLAGLPPQAEAKPPQRRLHALPAYKEPRALPASGTPSSAGKLVAPNDESRREVNPLALVGEPLDGTRDDAGRQGALAGVEWRRLEILPGLELHVRKDASAFVQGLAAAIAAGRFAK